MESGNVVSVNPVNEALADLEILNNVVEEVDSSITEVIVNQPSEKTQNLVKVKNSKLGKSSPNTSTFGRAQRPGLTQSLSFPVKSRSPAVEPTVSTSASSRSHLVNRRSSTGLKPVKTAVKEDDGASSTGSPKTSTPGGRRRNSISGFTSRLDERAEKRKEFYSKIEEKVQAKEVEKSNLQAKSKESQDEEIKKLRKSLTFKATPMPNFYKEPPPKPQLKKIPTTRPRSPKLGKSKSSVGKSLEPVEMADSPRAERDKTMSPRFNVNPTSRDKASNTHNRKSLTKTSEVKTSKSKEKVLKQEMKEEKASQAPSGGPHEVEDCVEVDTVQESGLVHVQPIRI